MQRPSPNGLEAAARRLFVERRDSPDEAPDPPDDQPYGEDECDHDSVISRVYGNFADSENTGQGLLQMAANAGALAAAAQAAQAAQRISRIS